MASKAAAPGAPLCQGIKHQQQDKAGLRPRQCIRVGAADARAGQPRGRAQEVRWRADSDRHTLQETEQGRADRRRLRSATQVAAAEMGGAAGGSAAQRSQGLMQEAVRITAPRCRSLSNGPPVGAVLARLHGTARERQKCPSA
jgi:hypothetical protein